MTRKADAIAREVGCIVIAPDTYRGESTRFIPRAIYLALGTPQVHPSGLGRFNLSPKGILKSGRWIGAISFNPF